MARTMQKSSSTTFSNKSWDAKLISANLPEQLVELDGEQRHLHVQTAGDQRHQQVQELHNKEQDDQRHLQLHNCGHERLVLDELRHR